MENNNEQVTKINKLKISIFLLFIILSITPFVKGCDFGATYYSYGFPNPIGITQSNEFLHTPNNLYGWQYKLSDILKVIKLDQNILNKIIYNVIINCLFAVLIIKTISIVSLEPLTNILIGLMLNLLVVWISVMMRSIDVFGRFFYLLLILPYTILIIVPQTASNTYNGSEHVYNVEIVTRVWFILSSVMWIPLILGIRRIYKKFISTKSKVDG